MKPPAQEVVSMVLHSTKCINANRTGRYDCVCHTESSVDLRLNNREVMKRLLRHWGWADFQYDGFSGDEKSLLTKEEFEALVEELRE